MRFRPGSTALGVPHSLQFHWVVDDGKERRTDMHYTHSLGRGLVSLGDD